MNADDIIKIGQAFGVPLLIVFMFLIVMMPILSDIIYRRSE